MLSLSHYWQEGKEFLKRSKKAAAASKGASGDDESDS